MSSRLGSAQVVRLQLHYVCGRAAGFCLFTTLLYMIRFYALVYSNFAKKCEQTDVYSVYSIGYEEMWIQNNSLCFGPTYEIKVTNFASEIVGSLPAFLVDVCQPLLAAPV